MSFEQWNARDVEYRLLDAAETQMLLPRVGGPSGMAGLWPEYALDYRGMNLRRRASAEAISRMDEAFGWINSFLAESERKVLYAWLYFKTRKGRTVAEYAEKSGMHSKTLRRAVIAYCQCIANNLNKNGHALKTSSLAEMSQMLAYESADSVPQPRLKRSPSHMMLSPDARPTDTSPEALARAQKLIAKLNRKLRRQRREDKRRRKTAP
jgi:hypothetical protein